MLRFATLVLAFGLPGAPALAEGDLSPHDRGAIRTTIESWAQMQNEILASQVALFFPLGIAIYFK